MLVPIYYAGTPEEVAHHARPLLGEFDVRIEDADNVVRHARPGDLCLFYNEFFPRYRTACHLLRERQCATLYALDGILEWRSLWDFPDKRGSTLWAARPLLSHKAACIGRSQARVFESWGYADQCELVGVPRFDSLANLAPRMRRPEDPFVILVLTAKCAGFTPQQLHLAAQSLKDLKAWLERNPCIHGTRIESVWRITQGLECEVGVENSLRDTTGQDLAQALAQVDAVITTPSTAMLEGMLQGIPVALLDYNNAPHYVPAAWRITAPGHFDQVVPELVAPPRPKLDYQSHLLHDALECDGPALPRMCELIHRMHAEAQRAASEGRALVYPAALLPRPAAESPARDLQLDYGGLFPENPQFRELDARRLQAVVADVQQTAATLAADNQRLMGDLAASGESVRRLTEQLLASSETVRQLGERVCQHDETVCRLTDQLVQSGDAVRRLADQNLACNDALQRLFAELAHFKSKLPLRRKVQRELRRLRDQLRALWRRPPSSPHIDKRRAA